MSSPARQRLMRAGSAEKVAALRALGASEHDPAVRNPDFLARDFLADQRTLHFVLRVGSLPGLRACGRWIFERIGPGAYWMELARVRHFDRILLAEVAGGVRQVIVLGAGLDSRAYRFAARLAGARVFEVDRPAMIARKRGLVETIVGSLPAPVAYVPVDLTTDDLGSGLAAAGFDREAPALVLWIGVSMYLPGQAFSDVLRWVAELPAGSSIAFDYMEREFFDEAPSRGSRRIRRLIELSGERLVRGLRRDAVPALLSEHGLAERSHLGPTDLEERYLRRGNGKLAGRPWPFVGFVHADVAGA